MIPGIDPNMFGKPGEGIHFHVGGIAIVDVLLTLIVAILIALYFDVCPIPVFLLIFVLGEIAHYAVGIDTAVIKKLKSIA